MKTTATLRVYDREGKEEHHVTFESHWNDRDMVVIVTPGGETLTLLADEVTRAAQVCRKA